MRKELKEVVAEQLELLSKVTDTTPPFVVSKTLSRAISSITEAIEGLPALSQLNDYICDMHQKSELDIRVGLEKSYRAAKDEAISVSLFFRQALASATSDSVIRAHYKDGIPKYIAAEIKEAISPSDSDEKRCELREAVERDEAFEAKLREFIKAHIQERLESRLLISGKVFQPSINLNVDAAATSYSRGRRYSAEEAARCFKGEINKAIAKLGSLRDAYYRGVYRVHKATSEGKSLLADSITAVFPVDNNDEEGVLATTYHAMVALDKGLSFGLWYGLNTLSRTLKSRPTEPRGDELSVESFNDFKREAVGFKADYQALLGRFIDLLRSYNEGCIPAELAETNPCIKASIDRGVVSRAVGGAGCAVAYDSVSSVSASSSYGSTASVRLCGPKSPSTDSGRVSSKKPSLRIET